MNLVTLSKNPSKISRYNWFIQVSGIPKSTSWLCIFLFSFFHLCFQMRRKIICLLRSFSCNYSVRTQSLHFIHSISLWVWHAELFSKTLTAKWIQMTFKKSIQWKSNLGLLNQDLSLFLFFLLLRIFQSHSSWPLEVKAASFDRWQVLMPQICHFIVQAVQQQQFSLRHGKTTA